MNLSLIRLEVAVVGLGLLVLLLDLWLPASRRRLLGWGAAAGLLGILGWSYTLNGEVAQYAFDQLYVLDGLALFFKRLFLLGGALVLVLAVEFSDRLHAGVSEFFSLMLFALTGMMLAASAYDFSLLFVSVELMAITFYVLTGFQRRRTASLEAGVKYLILGAVSSALLIYGIALVYGVSGTLNFGGVAAQIGSLAMRPLFLVGLLLIMVALGFKIAAVPMQIWVPDVYQGAPTPVTAFLAVGSKAAGFVLVMRVFLEMATEITMVWESLLMGLAALTILYGNLCALPQRNLKRMLAYSSVAHAGYLLLGVAVVSVSGSSAVLYYLFGYLFAVVAAFTVMALVIRQCGAEEVSALSGLHERSPLLAVTMTLAMVSLAGVPPLAGFFGKFLLFKAVAERAMALPACYGLLAVAIVGVVISLYYYFAVVRVIYWSSAPADRSPIAVSWPVRLSLGVCLAGMLYLGMAPGAVLQWATQAARFLDL